MNFSNFTQIQKISFTDLQTATAHRHMIADIVLVDKTVGDREHPYVFQLEEGFALSLFDALENDKKIDLESRHCPFILVGKKSLINRNDKIIHLNNEDEIRYQYLIVVTGDSNYKGSSRGNSDYSLGLQTLIDALKIRPTAPYSPEVNRSPGNAKSMKVTESSISPHSNPFYKDKAPKLICHKMSAPYGSSPSSKRLFLVEF